MEDEKISAFKGRGVLVKSLAVLLTLLIIILIALFVNLVLRKEELSCSSEQCIKTSAELIKFIDQTVDPCDDFHRFICNNFMRNPNQPRVKSITEQLNAMLSEPLKFEDPRPLVMQKLFYQSCLNLGAIDIDQEDTILDLFSRLGGWPVLRGANWNGSFYDWTEFLVKTKNLGLKFEWFLTFRVYEDLNGTQINYLKIDIPSYLKPVGSDMRHFRKELLTDIAVFMGAPKSIAHYETAKTIDFEDDLGIIAEKYRYQRDWNETADKLTIGELQQIWPSILWLELIQNITGNQWTSYDYVLFYHLEYLRDLNKLLLGTPKRIQVDFILWKIIEDLWPYLSFPIRNRFEQFYLEVHHKEPEVSRQKFCLNGTRNQFPLVADSIFIREIVYPAKRHLVREMISMIMGKFTAFVEGAQRMNREIRREALRKIRDISFLIGGPSDIYDEAKFNHDLHILGFEFRSVNIITMLRERQLWFYNYYYNQINRKVSPDKIEYYQRHVNITDFLVINQNTIVIPAAVLQDAVYNPALPNYLNYATLAKAISKELFDLLFRDNQTYWAPDSFDDIIKCFVQDTSYFFKSEAKKNEWIKEHLSDLVSADIAYDSYLNWARMHPQELPLPGLNFSPNQIFWMQANRMLCLKPNGERHLQEIEDSRLKMLETLRHSYNFAEHYNCQAGAQMNPLRKCNFVDKKRSHPF